MYLSGILKLNSPPTKLIFLTLKRSFCNQSAFTLVGRRLKAS